MAHQNTRSDNAHLSPQEADEASVRRSEAEEVPRRTGTNAPPQIPRLQRQQSTATASTRARRRRKNTSVEWREPWTADSWKNGRVLLIDYVAKQHTVENRRKIAAQEFSDINGLRKFYNNQDLSHQAALRVIHVQNAPWATRFLLHKFNIDASDDLIGTNFGRWARFDKPKRRGQGKAAKPIPSGKTFRAQRDPWRGINRAGFGLDYLKQYSRHKVEENASTQGLKMMELNHYDSQDNPTYGFDAYAQRISVYVQLTDKETGHGASVDPEIHNPYTDNEEEYREYQRLKKQYDGSAGEAAAANGAADPQSPQSPTRKKYIPKLSTLDNGSTVIIFESSPTGSVSDTLIGARQEVEQRWRRLTFYLPREDTSDDERLAIECMDFILRDIFKALAFTWEKYINVCETHTSILEDKIYENPADESRAPELWTNSSLWLKVERLLVIHTDMVRELRNHLREVARENPNDDDPWLSASAEELQKLTTQFKQGVANPTANLSDLMYKSVGIRDARMSNQLGLSMWRLSWITFIFLPLTFVCGFFGMNVDTFEGNPSIKWFFISSVPLFIVVLVIWYGVKHSLASQRQSPLRRGVYEQLFYELAEMHPQLWTRRGPRDGIIPVGWWSALKWQLITRWFDPENTIVPSQRADPALEELGSMARMKRYLIKRWLNNIIILPEEIARQARAQQAAEELEAATAKGEVGAMGELLGLSTPIALAPNSPAAASAIAQRWPLERFRSLSPARTPEGGRIGYLDARTKIGDVEVASALSEALGVMVEEASEDEVGEESD